ncbi:MAG: DUF3187 family protein [Planctomycetes bacterium]|nr:DUF3187 family protein [Planctomycetota bacterium]
MDGELLRVGTRLRLGVGGGGEVGAELPFAHAAGGFLDDFVIHYHEWFGFPDQGRDDAPRDAFGVEATAAGRTVYRLEAGGVELLDVPLSYTQSVLESGRDRIGLAVRGGVELPTGDQGRGYGNGGVDVGFGVLADLPTSWAEFTAHAQHTFAATPSAARGAGVDFGDVTSVGGGVELPLSPSLAAVVQLEWETSALRELGFPKASRDQLQLWTGGRLLLGERLGLEVTVGEDLVSFVSPDFTIWIGLAVLPRTVSDDRHHRTGR